MPPQQIVWGHINLPLLSIHPIVSLSIQIKHDHGLPGYLLEQFLYYIWKFLQDVSAYNEGVQG